MPITYHFYPHKPIMVVRTYGVITPEDGRIVFRATMKYLETNEVPQLYRVGDISNLVMSDDDFEKAIHQAVETFRNKGGTSDPRIVPISVVGNALSIAFANEIQRRCKMVYPVFYSLDDALAYVEVLLEQTKQDYTFR